jgi:hypothetical protein
MEDENTPMVWDLFFGGLRRIQELGDEIDKGAEFGRRKVAGGVKGVEGKSFVGPVGEEVDEFAAVETVLYCES